MIEALRDRVWALRTRKIKLGDIARLAGISKSTFHKFLYSSTPNLTLDVLERIGKAIQQYEDDLN